MSVHEVVSADKIYKAVVKKEDAYSVLSKFVEMVESFNVGECDVDIVREYLSLSRNCHEILELVQNFANISAKDAATLIHVSTSILVRVANDLKNFSTVGLSFVTDILSSGYKTLHNFLKPMQKSARMKLTLHLLSAMVVQGPQAARDVFIKMGFSGSNFSHLLNKCSQTRDGDVRTSYLNLVVLLLITGDNNLVRQIVEAKGFLNGIFPGLVHDRSSTIILVLETFLTKIIRNPLIAKTGKVRLFNDFTLKYVLNLYDWKGAAVKPHKPLKRKLGDDGEFRILEASEEMISSVHESVHMFLLEVCCSYKNGIIFRDTSYGSSGKNQNHVLTNILKSLSSPHLHSLKSNFVISVLKACPDQVKFYLPSLVDSLSPRLSVLWLQAIELLKKIVEVHDYTSILFEIGEKMTVSKMVSMAKEMIFPEVISISRFIKCLKDEHPFMCHNLLSYLCCTLHCVKKIVDYCDSPRKNSLYSSEELKDFYINFLLVVAKAVPEFTVIQVYWHRLTINNCSEFGDDGEITDDFEVPSPKIQLSQVLELFKIYREVLPATNISHDFCLNIFSGLKKIQEENPNTKDFVLQLELLDFIATYNSSEEYINMQNIDFSPVMIALDIYLIADDIQSKSRVKHVILKFVSSIYSLDICEWELNIWLKNLKVNNSANQRTLMNFFVEVLGIVAKKELSLINIRIKDGKLGCSSLLFAALFRLKRHHNDLEECIGYVQKILLNIMHYQLEPQQLLTHIEEYNHLFSQNVVNYWKMLSSYEEFKTPGKNALNYLLERPVTCSETLHNVFLSANFNLNNASSNALAHFAQLFKEIRSQDEEIEILLWQLLTYINLEASLIFETSSSDRNINIAFYSSIIEELIGKAGVKEVETESKNYYKKHIMKIILEHPIILKCFLLLPTDSTDEKSYEAILTLTNLVLSIFSENFLNDEDFSSKIHLKPFKEKAFVFCETYLTSFYQNDTYSAALWDIVKKIISMFPSMFSGQNIVGLLEKILTIDDEDLQKLDPKLRVLSTLVDMYCENDDYLLFSTQCARILICKFLRCKRKKHVQIIKVLKKHPAYSLALKEDDIDQLIAHQASSNFEILDILTSHNVEIKDSVKNFIFSISDNMEEGNKEFLLHVVPMVANHISSSKKRKSDAFRTSVAVTYWNRLCDVIVENISQDIAYPIANVGKVFSSLDLYNVVDQHGIQKLLQILVEESKHALPSNSKCSTLLEIILYWKNSWRPESFLQIIINWMRLSFKKSSDLNETLLKFCLESINYMEDSVLRGYFKDSSEWSDFVQAALKAAFKSGNSGVLILDMLTCICEKMSALKSNKIESVKKEEMKIVHTFLTSHSNFFPVMLDDSGENKCLKGSILLLVVALVKINVDLCKDTHIPLLLASYGGTLSSNDQMILQLLKLYEDAGINMENFSPFIWGNSAVSHYSVNKNMKFLLLKQPRMAEILGLFQKDFLYSLVLNFPFELKLQMEIYRKEESHLQYDKVYDPRFVLQLASVLLSPGAYVNCREFIESGVLGVIFRSLSSEDKDMRALGYYCLTAFYSHLQSVRSKQCQVWIALLDSIRYSIEKPNFRIPSIVTLFLAKAVNILVRPDNQLYTVIYKFLTVKPTLDLMQIPEYNKLFKSTDIAFRLHRSWILSLVAEGLQSSLDFHICRKLDLFNELQSYYRSPISLEVEKIKILQIHLASMKIFSSARSLCQTLTLLWLYDVIKSEPEEHVVNSLNDIMHMLWHTCKNPTIDPQPASNGDGSQVCDAPSNEQIEETPGKGKQMYSSFPSNFLHVHRELIFKLSFRSLDGIGLLKYLQTFRDVLIYVKNNNAEKLFTPIDTALLFSHVSSLVKHWQNFCESKLISSGNVDQENRSRSNHDNISLIHQCFSEILMFWVPRWSEFQEEYDAEVSVYIDIMYLALKNLSDNQNCINLFSHWLLRCLSGDIKQGLINSLCSSSNIKSVYCTRTILSLYEIESSIYTRKTKRDKFPQVSAWAEICSQLNSSEYVSHQMSLLQSLLQKKS